MGCKNGQSLVAEVWGPSIIPASALVLMTSKMCLRLHLTVTILSQESRSVTLLWLNPLTSKFLLLLDVH